MCMRDERAGFATSRPQQARIVEGRAWESMSSNSRSRVTRDSLPIAFLDLILGRIGLDAQLVVQLCFLDHPAKLGVVCRL